MVRKGQRARTYGNVAAFPGHPDALLHDREFGERLQGESRSAVSRAISRVLIPCSLIILRTNQGYRFQQRAQEDTLMSVSGTAASSTRNGNRRTTRHRLAPTVNITLDGTAIQKILEFFSSPISQPAEETQASHLRPTLRPWIGIIDQILKEDADVPKRYRTTAMQILKTLRDEHGFTLGYNALQEYVKQARADAGQAPSRRSITANRKTSEKKAVVQKDPITPAPKPPVTMQAAPPFVPLRLSLHPKKPGTHTEQAFEWLQRIVQGKMPIKVLAGELSHVPENELKALFEAATKGERYARNRALVALAYSRGINCTPICSFLKISEGTLFRQWRDFRLGGTDRLLIRKPRSDKRAFITAIQNAVFSLLHSPPSAHGFNRTTWRLADMKVALDKQCNDTISCKVIREIIVNAGWKWRLARRVLTSNDPEYREKVDRIKETLASLEKDEAFFSIDEYGPFAIKKKGGRKRVAPGEQYVVPQWQKSKGYLILTAALELSTNQLTHFYSPRKNTDEMIKLADILRKKYRGYRTLYLSWDAASWHISKDLANHLEKVNLTAEAEGSPVIKTMPLPAGAQFLNVIESVFSGMARAIIHNSDYPSVSAATKAIDRYIEERNAHFHEHPQRAGKKIWGQERVPSFFAEEHNCKDPMYMFPQ